MRVIAPARSLSLPWMTEELKTRAIERLDGLGLKVSFGAHVREMNDFDSSSIGSRVSDIHEAFCDDSIQLVLTVIGGFNSNQLLRYLDYDLIRRHPKILCGYSDITALANAMYAKTGLVSYLGPHYFSFGDKKGFDYTLEYFNKCLLSVEPFDIVAAPQWSDDRWANDQKHRNFFLNEGYWVLREGEAEGTIIGGNLNTLNLLQGTEYMPDLRDAILFLEDDDETRPEVFDRDLQSLIHQPGFDRVRGIMIGRFQKASNMTQALLRLIIASKRELAHMPIIANVDFGHTTPQVTLPIGGTTHMYARQDDVSLSILRH